MALPISSELRLLLVERDDLSTLLEQLEDLSQRLDTVEGTLRTDVELVNGSGFSVEGVVCVFSLFPICFRRTDTLFSTVRT